MPDEQQSPIPPAAGVVARSTIRIPAGRILHVDDDEANRYAVTRALVRAGFDVVEAASGGEALSQLACKPDLVILDVRLPDIDGFEVCRRMKASPATATIPVLHLSANFISSEDKAHGLNGGADAYLVRPVAPVELLATVNALLRVRRAEEALRAAKEEAENARLIAETANRVKDEFLATLSHELRTPLTAIIGWASLLRRGKMTPAEHEEGLKTIERNAKAQAQLIDDLLDVSRIISGKLRLDVQRVDLAQTLEAAIAVVRPLAQQRGVTLTSELGVAPQLLGDPNRLQQIFWNLLTNAVKFTPEGGTVRVQMAMIDSGHVDVVIVDSGRGISPDFLPYIFERFRQADASSKRSQGGLGLGLAIVRQLVELHRGSIRAHSDGEGAGATFTVRLPLNATHDDASADASSSTNAHDRSGADGTLSEVAVLVVEDDADCRTLTMRILEGAGAHVVETSSVAAAMRELAQRRFDVIVSDIGMPLEDGYDLVRLLRALPPDAGGAMPAIALSAFAQPESQRKMLASGFTACVSKPIDPHELVAVVQRVVPRR